MRVPSMKDLFVFLQKQNNDVDLRKIRRRIEDSLRKTNDKVLILSLAKKLNIRIN